MAKGDIISRLKLESGEFDAKIKRAGQELLNYAEHCRKMGLEMGYANKDAKEFAKALGSMQTVSQTARGKINELSEAFVNAKVIYKNMTDEEKKGEFGKNLAASLDQLKTRLKDAKKDLADVQKELNSMDDSKFGQFGSIIDGIGQKMGLNANITELVTSKTALMTAGIGASVAIIGKATEAWAKYNSELSKQDQITTVTTGLDGEAGNRMTDQARALVDTYNVDFREVINAANTLMTQFGQSGDDAMSLIRQGMQGMIQGDGPKLLSMIQQYAPSFRDAGIAADQLVAIIHNSEGGLFTDANMNAIVMGIKNIRLMTNQTSDALAKMGIDGQEMTRKLNDGSMTIFEAMQQVSNAINHSGSASQAAGEVMQQVFGRQGAAAGTKLGEAIATLNTNLDETKKKTGELGDSLDGLYEANLRLNTAIRDAFGYDGWEQMANGIKSNLIGALSDVIEHLAIIEEGFGKIGRFFGGGGGNKGGGIGYSDIEKTQQWINNGKDDDERRRRYDKAIADLQKKLNNVGKEYSVKNADGSISFKIDDAETQARKRAALEKRMSMLYATRYTPEPDPIKPVNPTNPTHTTTTTHIKTEEQLNNEQIQKLTQEYIKAGDERRAAIRAEIKDLQDKNKVIKKLSEEAQGLKFDEGSLPSLTKQLQELQQDQSKAADGKEWDDYQKKIEETNGKINVLKGNLPKDKQATFTMNVNADQLEKLRALSSADDKTIKVNVEQGRVDLPDIPMDDKTYTVTVTAYTSEAMKQFRDLTADIEGTTVKIEPKVEIQEQDLRTPFQKLQDSIKLELSAKNVDVDKNTLKSLTEVVTKYNIQTGTIDMSKVMAQTEELTKSGMTAGEAYSKTLQDALAKNLDLSTIQQQIGEQINIPDETWQALQDQINEKLKELGIKPIKIDFKTGNIAKDGKDVAKNWQGAASAISSVGSAISQIEDPAAKVMGTIAQAIATIALTYAESLEGTFTPWDWIAGAAAGLAQMTAVISAIHSSTGYAEGGMIKGNSYSGDNLMAQGPNGQLIGLNAGEIVLNRAQQGVIAGALQGGGQTVRVVGKLSGESIFICAENWAKRTGKGEFVTWR